MAVPSGSVALTLTLIVSPSKSVPPICPLAVFQAGTPPASKLSARGIDKPEIFVTCIS